MVLDATCLDTLHVIFGNTDATKAAKTGATIRLHFLGFFLGRESVCVPELGVAPPAGALPLVLPFTAELCLLRTAPILVFTRLLSYHIDAHANVSELVRAKQVRQLQQQERRKHNITLTMNSSGNQDEICWKSSLTPRVP